MASVFLVRHRGSNQKFALKIMTRSTASQPHYREAFWREAQSVARLGHPHIVGIVDVGIVPAEPRIADFLQVEAPFIVMEYVPDGTLDFLTFDLDWVAFRAVLLQILDALAHAHARGVIHRDLKPANILISNSDELHAKISDFGIARLTDEIHTAALVEARVKGTPRYMAPEQIRGLVREQGPWTDLYSLGVLAWTVACGDPPFHGDSSQVLSAHLRAPLPAFLPRFLVPDGFRDWLETLLVKDPLLRCRRAADARYALMALPDLDPSRAGSLVSSGGSFDLSTTMVDVVDHHETDDMPRRPGAFLSHPAPVPATWGLPHDTDFESRDAQLGVVVLRSSPFVGRVVERDLLWDQLRKVTSDGPRLAIVGGEAGVGRSRLAQWFGERSHELGCCEVLQVRHGSEGGVSDGLGGMISRAAQLEGLTHELVVQNLAKRSDLDKIDVEVLASMVTGMGHMRVSRAERFASVRRFLRGLCADRPLVVIFDDLEWGLEATTFLRAVMRDFSELPMLAIAIPSTSQGLEGIAHLVIDLKPLADDELTLMARGMIHLTPPTMADLMRRIEGSPRIAVRLLRSWVLEGALKDTGDGFELRPNAHTLGDFDEIWREQLAMLLQDDPNGTSHLTLLSAALLGVDVNDDELDAVMRVHRTITSPQLVGRMVQLGVAEHTGLGWRFSDQAFRVFLCGQAKAAKVWVELNVALADALRQMLPRRGMKRRIATHLVEASRSAEAIDHYLDAANDALLEGELELARELIALRQNSIERLRLPMSDERRGLTFRITANILHSWSRGEEFREFVDRGIATATDQAWLRVETELKLLRCESQILSGEILNAIPVLEELIITWSQHEPGLLLADAYRQLSRAQTAAGELRKASQSLDAAVGIATELGARPMIANCVWERGDLLRSLGDFDGAMQSFSLAFALYDELGARIGCGWALNAIGDLQRVRGDLDAAEASLRQARQLFELAGTREGLGVDVNLAILELCRGEFDLASEQLMLLHPMFVANSGHFYQLIIELGLVAAELGKGAIAKAEAWLATYEAGVLNANYVEPDFLVLGEIALVELPEDLVQIRDRINIIIAFQRRGLEGARPSGFTVRRPLPLGTLDDPD